MSSTNKTCFVLLCNFKCLFIIFLHLINGSFMHFIANKIPSFDTKKCVKSRKKRLGLMLNINKRISTIKYLANIWLKCSMFQSEMPEFDLKSGIKSFCDGPKCLSGVWEETKVDFCSRQDHKFFCNLLR